MQEKRYSTEQGTFLRDSEGVCLAPFAFKVDNM